MFLHLMFCIKLTKVGMRGQVCSASEAAREVVRLENQCVGDKLVCRDTDVTF